MKIGPVDKLRFLAKIAANKRLVASDLRCAIIITDLHNQAKGRAWPSWSYLTKATGCGRSTIARAVKRLDAQGIIKKQSGWKGRSNSYVPAFSSLQQQSRELLGCGVAAVANPVETRTEVSPVTPQQSHACEKHGRTDETQSYHYPAEQPAKQGSDRGDPTSGGASPGGERRAGGAPGGGGNGFTEWWSAYPKQQGYLMAKEAYAFALNGNVTEAELLRGAIQYAVATKNYSDPKYIKWPANWLKKECWKEDPQPPRPNVKSGEVSARENSKTKKGRKQKRPESEAVCAKRAAEEPLANIIARDKIDPIRPLGKIGGIEILEGPNWRNFCVVREPHDNDTMRITKMALGYLAGPRHCSIDDIVKAEADGRLSFEAALAERNGLAVVNKWSKEELKMKLAEARRSLEDGKYVPATVIVAPHSYEEIDFG